MPAITASNRSAARMQLGYLGRKLQRHHVLLRPLEASEVPEGASRELVLAARCYDDAFWRIEELRNAESLARSAKGLALLARSELAPNVHGFIDAGYGPRYMLPVWLPTNIDAARPFGPGLA